MRAIASTVDALAQLDAELGGARREAVDERLRPHEPVDAAVQAARHRRAVERRLGRHQGVGVELVELGLVPGVAQLAEQPAVDVEPGLGVRRDHQPAGVHLELHAVGRVVVEQLAACAS